MAKRRKHPSSRKVAGLSEEGRQYIPSGIVQTGEAMRTAKLFKNGRSQAVRLPKEFRFEGDEVYVKRAGEGVMLIPKEKPKANPWKDFFEALDMFDPAFPLERRQPTEHQVRKSLDDLFPPARRRPKRK